MDESIPYTSPDDRVQRIADKLGIPYGRAIVYALRKKLISAKEANEINFTLLSTRQYEFKKSLLDCARYAPDPDLFLQQFVIRLEAASTAEISALKKLDKLDLDGGNECHIALFQVMERADIRWMPKNLALDIRLAHLMDKHQTCHVVMVDQKQYGSSLEFYELEKAFGAWLAHPRNFMLPTIKELNSEKVKEYLSVKVRAIAKNKEKDEVWVVSEMDRRYNEYPRVLYSKLQLVDVDLERSDILIFETTLPWLEHWRHSTRNLRPLGFAGNSIISKIKNGENAGFVTGGACLSCSLATPEADHVNNTCRLAKIHKNAMVCGFCTGNHPPTFCKLLRAHMQRAPFRRDWDSCTIDTNPKNVLKGRNNYNNNDNGYYNNYNKKGRNNNRARSRNYNNSGDRSRYDTSESNNSSSRNTSNEVINTDQRPSDAGSKNKEKKKNN